MPKKELDALLKKMLKVMDELNGVGIAAPQLGVNRRVAIAQIDKHRAVVMLDPVLLSATRKCEIAHEGCLSFPGKRVRVARSRQITIEYRDADKVRHVKTLKGWWARIAQHELDHCNGVCIVDSNAA